MTKKCRVWWPNDISSTNTSLALFGWFISTSPTSLDVVVAFAQNLIPLHSDFQTLQLAINQAHEAMPIRLQDKSNLTLLGRCMAPSGYICQTCKLNMIDVNHKHPFNSSVASNHDSDSSTNCISSRCGCLEDDGLFQQYRQANSPSSTWIHLVQGDHSFSSDAIYLVPTLHHLLWNGDMLSSVELHVMVYETPRYCSHHFSIGTFDSKGTTFSPKRPKWIDELSQKPQLINLDMVILAINSSAAAKAAFGRYFRVERSYTQLPILRVLLNLSWRLFATVVATLSTFLYIVLQSLHKLARHGSEFRISDAVANIFSNTLINFQLRCHQILYWPIFLNDSTLRAQACVEFVEKAALRRHSLWSSAMIDVILGNLLGYALLFHINAVCSVILNFATHFTDDVLRTGCVWLMGVPAGFKLNTELAEVLGAFSLNAIQIWSTLWFLAAQVFYNVIRVIAFLGIFLGMTMSAALIMDMITIAAFNVYILHQFVGFFYSLQIEALTALWRLFRGRKWNPLRQRLDSYEYSVEQHVVGSLMFTPLLLLLPTTSVFYIFFAIMSLAIMSLRSLVQIIVSVIHDTPYAKVVLWLLRPKRFPSGIWFEILHYQRESVSSSVAGTCFSSQEMLQDQSMDARKSVLLPLFLHSNVLTFGKLISPHYKSLFSRVHGPSMASAVSGILTGKSIKTPESEVPKKMPWISIPYKDYWHLCYHAVLACKQ